jgi:hypothetical protein
VLLLAGIAVNASNPAVDDRMDGMGEDKPAAVAPGVDIATDPVDGHLNSDFCVRKWSCMVAAFPKVCGEMRLRNAHGPHGVETAHRFRDAT